MIDNLAQHLDFANHHASATPSDIHALCKGVMEYGFNSAFVNPCYITLARESLGNAAKVGTAIAFPLGQDTLSIKKTAVNEAVMLGADELDIVPNIGAFLAGEDDAFYAELKAIVESTHMVGKPVVVKFIIETGFFDKLADGKTRIQKASRLIQGSGADFVKICSGMGPRGASVEDVKLVREAVGATMKIKVAGGIDTLREAEELINAGADRIGTSHAIEIVTEKRASS
ncbi:deoxyribose-phosphate aldolase [Patescibacteria group bacterium]|nr:deoxyribose-phosphate aldolase [Patescibacteria group bacterium]MBU1472526.1 deoxyribose-phosphate aldolase [Patescibacteria group bacterium]MBU2460101.1 deoxyribose-phosphate aldolase [Patescibacteria group bacterium]MBU2544670.1 deoxyribose-phosphate aldolase [Patescibacteria group bacterium]